MSEKYYIRVYINESQKEEQIAFPMIDYTVNNNGKHEHNTVIYEQPNKIGSILLDFIQKDIKELCYYIFKTYGFQTLLNEEEKKSLLNTNAHNFQEENQILEKLYIKYKDEFESYRKQIIDILNYCIFNDTIKDLKPIEKLYVFENINSLKDYPILEHTKFNQSIQINKEISHATEQKLINLLKDKDNNRYGIQEIYEIDNFYNLLYLELYFILQGKTYIKKCNNCGQYFLTTNSSVIYCNNIYEEGKTCREIGANKVFIKNLEKDDAYKLYRKIYKKKQALAKTKNLEYEMQYNLFKINGKDKKNAYKLNEISKEEFIEWLNKQ